jgi:imidazole glycerol-phosphate synthase subunit HisH
MIAVIDYRAGNLTSVRLAFEELKVGVVVTSDPDEILRAERVVFPGVGAAGAAMGNLVSLGLRDVIPRVVEAGIPFLGICLGTQILLDMSEEDGGTRCLGLIPGTVRLFMPESPLDKVPQMGWNNVAICRRHPVLEGIEDGSEFYFVHSYYPSPASETVAVGKTEYAGVRFASILTRRNLFATQFHPEKSGRTGMRLLENFCKWNGRS